MNEYKAQKAANILIDCMKPTVQHSLEGKTEESKYKKYMHGLIEMKYGLKGTLRERHGL